MSIAAGLWKLFRDQAERGSGIGVKLFGFIAESVFTIIPESCSGSPPIGVRNHPGIAFTFARIPQQTRVSPRSVQRGAGWSKIPPVRGPSELYPANCAIRLFPQPCSLCLLTQSPEEVRSLESVY
jgi:hypothetical protein